MTLPIRATILAVALAPPFATTGRAETPAEWIAIGTRVHGGFGAFIPIGIRIGLDALARLGTQPRGVTVMFHSGAKPPCPCIADGVLIATQASPGQGTLQVAADRAPEGLLAVVVIRDRKIGAGLRYAIKDEWLAKVAEWNRSLDPAGRYQAAMAAEGLFEVAPAP
jgi:formylmethanofuran dehydrogenase subunit E